MDDRAIANNIKALTNIKSILTQIIREKDDYAGELIDAFKTTKGREKMQEFNDKTATKEEIVNYLKNQKDNMNEVVTKPTFQEQQAKDDDEEKSQASDDDTTEDDEEKSQASDDDTTEDDDDEDKSQASDEDSIIIERVEDENEVLNVDHPAVLVVDMNDCLDNIFPVTFNMKKESTRKAVMQKVEKVMKKAASENLTKVNSEDTDVKIQVLADGRIIYATCSL